MAEIGINFLRIFLKMYANFSRFSAVCVAKPEIFANVERTVDSVACICAYLMLGAVLMKCLYMASAQGIKFA